MSSKNIDFTALAAPFPEEDLEWRIGQAWRNTNGEIGATCLAYVSARAIMNRLDDVCGPENWRAEYRVIPGDGRDVIGGVICALWIRVEGEWISKEDGAEQTDIESFKGGISSALKRAGVPWRIGRELYEMERTYATIVEQRRGANLGRTKDGTEFYWLPPSIQRKAAQAPGARQASSAAKVQPKQTGPASERDGLVRELMDLQPKYMAKFQDQPFVKIMESRYQRREAKQLSTDQMRDLVDWIRGELNAAAVTSDKPAASPNRKVMAQRCAELAKGLGWDRARVQSFAKQYIGVDDLAQMTAEQLRRLAGMFEVEQQKLGEPVETEEAAANG